MDGLWNGGWDAKLRCVAASAIVIGISVDSNVFVDIRESKTSCAV